ncbi:MAG: N-acetyl sugar amidotransferase [Cyclobacteriaceae bacterium]|nr:N-acetyl sugar amidotransferase [Cyclobacteriaceae bacterium]MCB0498979.1 N-acetyl sugar amidotransferase [Cyclobacteriaceae bacterium]MCB9238255.1 N-acetyl sugar amidotransferase [Flammeovirgaceae bacterium]MCO5272180.1 N-acetyl sugar amidotransferase [Cyclobacteriaceae bacterium]MCW5902705.1 N-acetyl sugar amidotransferase [Cyclobacteriaceae bacterium]
MQLMHDHEWVASAEGDGMENEIYRQCRRCVLDTTVPSISFNAQGECNFCEYYDQLADRTVRRDPRLLQKEFDATIEKIKETGKDKPYDCVLGVSGGMDSTYLALLAKRCGLRPLLVHFDNGWNSELAIKNIEQVVNRLGFGLHTFVMDWPEFKDLQRAYFKASVVDVEVPTDQLIFAALNKICFKKGIRYILAGNNIVTESINPDGWVFKNKMDLVNLKSIHKRHGTVKLRKIPRLGLFERYFYEAVAGIQTVNLLNLIPYNKDQVKAEVQKELGWKDYGGKHYESTFTRYYQGCYLPKKFGIDKRKAHLSNLILSGQMKREEALSQLEEPPYAPHDQASDEGYVKKKLDFSDDEWKEIMEAAPVPHLAYKTERSGAHLFFYTLFRMVMYIPVRLLRLVSILHKPIKVPGGW